MAHSKIEWTEATWNPTTGCTKISTGCAHCYAEILSRRLKAMGVEKYKNGFQLTCHPSELLLPYKWRKPRIIFVNSMSDLFHEKLPFAFIQSVFKVMNDCQQHIFQVLTKRSNILEKYAPRLTWTPNIWMGVTVENKEAVTRIEALRKIPATVRFLSIEPMLSPITKLNLRGINWVIVGGESGPHARPIEKEWVIDIKNKCDKKEIPFFFKQWGGVNKKRTGKLLDGKTYCQMPLISRP